MKTNTDKKIWFLLTKAAIKIIYICDAYEQYF